MLFDAIATFLVGGSIIVSFIIIFLVNDAESRLEI